MTEEQRRQRRKEQIRVYNRRYYAKNAEKIRERSRLWNREKRRRDGPRTHKRCIQCGRDLPVEDFDRRADGRCIMARCRICREQMERAKKQPAKRHAGKPSKAKKEEPKKTRGCELCVNWPCFDGIWNLESDFSLTCKSFKKNDTEHQRQSTKQ